MKTNESVLVAPAKEKTLYWCTPWIALSILLNILVYIVLYLILRKKVQLAIPVSDAGRGIINKHRLIAWVAGLGGLGLVIFGFANIDTLVGVIVLGFLLILSALIYGNIKGTALRPTKMKNGYVWLAGAGRDYLASLPPHQG